MPIAAIPTASTPQWRLFPPRAPKADEEASFDDPDVGVVRLRVLDVEAVLAQWRAVDALDLEMAAAAFDADLFAVGDEFADAWTVEDMRAFFEVNAAVRAAVVSPVPSAFGADEIPAGYPPGLVRPDERWTSEALQRLDMRVLELAGMVDGPVCRACREAS